MITLFPKYVFAALCALLYLFCGLRSYLRQCSFYVNAADDTVNMYNGHRLLPHVIITKVDELPQIKSQCLRTKFKSSSFVFRFHTIIFNRI